MYNRYVPGHDGSYRRQTVAEPQKICPTPEFEAKNCEEPHTIVQQQEKPCRSASDGFDLGDLLLLCIIVLLMIDSDGDDSLPLMIMIGAFLLLQ